MPSSEWSFHRGCNQEPKCQTSWRIAFPRRSPGRCSMAFQQPMIITQCQIGVYHWSLSIIMGHIIFTQCVLAVELWNILCTFISIIIILPSNVRNINVLILYNLSSLYKLLSSLLNFNSQETTTNLLIQGTRLKRKILGNLESAYNREKYSIRTSVAYSYCWRDFAGENFRDTKVANLEHGSLSVHEDILCLEITMEDVEWVDMLNGY